MEKKVNDIFDLIPMGSENAISRPALADKCVAYGLIPTSAKWKDRYMRNLLEMSRRTHVICSSPKGGYYIPTLDDRDELEKYVKQEQTRAIKTFQSIKLATALLEDYRHNRFKPDEIDSNVIQG